MRPSFETQMKCLLEQNFIIKGHLHLVLSRGKLRSLTLDCYNWCKTRFNFSNGMAGTEMYLHGIYCIEVVERAHAQLGPLSLIESCIWRMT